MSIVFFSISTSGDTKENPGKISVEGQVTIPREIRERYGLLPGTEVRFEEDGDELRLVKGAGNIPAVSLT